MGKLSTRKPERIPSEEIQGRILSGFAGPSLSEQLKAYELALGPKNVSASSYVETDPSVMVKRNGKWVQPDRGTDIYDLTTDVIPDLPAILGGGLGAAYGGTQGAVGGATAGNVVKQRVGEALGLRDGVNETEAKLEGIGELVGPIGGKALAMVPMPFVALSSKKSIPKWVIKNEKTGAVTYNYTNDSAGKNYSVIQDLFGIEPGHKLSDIYEVSPQSIKPTEGYNEAYSKEIAEAFERGEEFLPIIVDYSGNVLDGHNRLAAAKMLGDKAIPIQVYTNE